MNNRPPLPKAGSKPDPKRPELAPAVESNGIVRVTLREIGKRLGISHAAVSLALRGRPGISDELRQKVQKVAAEMGYRPDPALAALNSYRRRVQHTSIRAALGWISLFRDPSRMHGFREADAYWRGAKEVAERHGYHLYEFFPDGKNSLAAVERVIRARNIEGLLLSPPESRAAFSVPPMEWSNYSLVRFGHGLGDSWPFHLVTSAQATNTVMAIRRMRELGYRRVGFVVSKRSVVNLQFIHGFLRAREDFPPEDRLDYLSLPEEGAGTDAKLLKQWLREQRPDAVFSNIATIRAQLEAQGCEVPGKLGLAVTSVHDCDADSGIDQVPMEIGRIGCETLISLLMNGHRGFPVHPREILIEGRWVQGETLPGVR